MPDDSPQFALPAGDPLHLPALIVAAGLAPSSSAARRLIDDGAVRLDGVAVAARQYDLERGRLADGVLTVGKRRTVRFVSDDDA